MSHYLRVRLFFDEQDNYLKANVVDGGYEKQPSKRARGHNTNDGQTTRTYNVWVEDRGLPFDRYIEEALEDFQRFKANGGFMYGRLDHRKEDKYGGHDGTLVD